jgi:hypothetical protein
MSDLKRVACVGLYPSDWPHTEAVIAGTREGLEALRRAIDEALEADGPAFAREVFDPDGEGHDLCVVPVAWGEPGLRAMYCDESFRQEWTVSECPKVSAALSAPRAGG